MHLNRRIAMPSLLLLTACGGSGKIQVTGRTVSVQTDQLLATYTKAERIDGVYMIFGGIAQNRSDMTSKATIVGLPMGRAQEIYAEYPDFYKCSSPGASQAQAATQQMDLVPADGQAFANLAAAIQQHQANLTGGGDRVCVKILGCRLKMSSAKVGDQEVLSQLPGPVRKDHFLVESATLVPASSALSGG